jgi:hypothetical protein
MKRNSAEKRETTIPPITVVIPAVDCCFFKRMPAKMHQMLKISSTKNSRKSIMSTIGPTGTMCGMIK